MELPLWIDDPRRGVAALPRGRRVARRRRRPDVPAARRHGRRDARAGGDRGRRRAHARARGGAARRLVGRDVAAPEPGLPATRAAAGSSPIAIAQRQRSSSSPGRPLTPTAPIRRPPSENARRRRGRTRTADRSSRARSASRDLAGERRVVARRSAPRCTPCGARSRSVSSAAPSMRSAATTSPWSSATTTETGPGAAERPRARSRVRVVREPSGVMGTSIPWPRAGLRADARSQTGRVSSPRPCRIGAVGLVLRDVRRRLALRAPRVETASPTSPSTCSSRAPSAGRRRATSPARSTASAASSTPSRARS